MKIRYFDYAATTPVSEVVLKEMLPHFSICYGNASSMYSIGRQSKKALEKARKRVSQELGANSNEIYFTSCGSESDNLAIKGVAYANKDKGNHIITSKIEHPAVLHSCQTLEKQGYDVTYLNVDKNGFICFDELTNAITNKTILISIMFANNEIGTIQPIKQIGAFAKEHNILFHTDAVQAVGNIKINVQDLNIDLLSISGHKLYAPKGVGALYVRDGINFEKLQDGGHQERDKRAGTENVAEIVGLGKAIEDIYKNFDVYNNHLLTLRDFYINSVISSIPDVKVNGSLEHRLPGNANISFKNIDGGELLFELDKFGICASSGSACSTGSASPSHVLTAIGLDSCFSSGTLRTTFGKDTTMEDIEFLVDVLGTTVTKLRSSKF